MSPKNFPGSAGNIAYTNLPYITDAGASCGANFNGLGATAGVTIVSGHEMAETVTDQFPSSGWTDSGGAGERRQMRVDQLGPGSVGGRPFVDGQLPVQSLWSNAFSSDAGGCVLSYP